MTKLDADSDGAPVGQTSPVTRRTLLEWLGKGAVMGLFSPLVQACGQGPGGVSDSDGFGADAADDMFHDFPGDLAAGDARETDEGSPDNAPADAPGDSTDAGPGDEGPQPETDTGPDCGFEPGPENHPVMYGWGERTVDRQDLAGILSSWELQVDGLVASPRKFSFCELRDLDLDFQLTDFHCVEGWSILDVPWDGIRLSRILDLVEPLPAATFLKITCRGGIYTESLPIDVARESRTLLAMGIGSNTLPLKHGFPCRIVVPRLLGYKCPKYVERIELVTEEHVGFWPAYGYKVSGEVPPERLREGRY
jgi:hypothetical protein